MIKLLLSFKGKTLDEFLLSDSEEIIIGQDPACTLQVESLAIDPRHARITPEDDKFILEDISATSGIFVNNNKVTRHELKNGDMFRLGKHVFKFSHEESKKGFDAMPTGKILHQKTKGWIQIMSGSNLGKTIQLEGAVTNISKSAAIARRHDGYYLTPLQGEKPPEIAGKPVNNESALLTDGDMITVGDIKLQFYLTDA
ncbi:MAG: FHA domain-containing protein [Gammaproteobacteria bacterium]|nr:FHA domain-containing protein [Gammaproteobacteria bacterium]